MSSPVQIPSLGESVTEATLLRWIKQDGETVSTDDPVCELETDKANVEIPAPAPGVLSHQKKAGDVVRIGETIATIEAAGAGKAAAKAAPVKTVEDKPAPKEAKPVSETHGDKTEGLSPSVRRLVREHGVNPEDLHGTGPRGRIVKEDVLEAAGKEAPKPAAKPVEQKMPAITERPGFLTPAASADGGVRRVPMTKIRKKIAERLVSAQHTAAMLTTFNEIDMTEVQVLREKYKAKFTETYGVNLGFLSFFARACVQGLKEFPVINASIEGEDILYHDHVHLGIAVSTDRGLVVPVLRNVEKLSFAHIESEIKRMAGAARDGKLGLNELGGGTFTITNGGVFGSLLSTPILNAPQSGILGLHAIQKRPVAVGDKVEIRPMMYVALSYDHRIVDGKDSVSFLVRLKQMLEDPARLMLEV